MDQALSVDSCVYEHMEHNQTFLEEALELMVMSYVVRELEEGFCSAKLVMAVGSLSIQ